jgi:hypothetical protein
MGYLYRVVPEIEEKFEFFFVQGGIGLLNRISTADLLVDVPKTPFR